MRGWSLLGAEMGMGKTVLSAAAAMFAALGAAASASGADAKSCTAELQRMIDGASANGGGRVNVPKGDHFVRCLILKSGVELHLESGARLIGSRNPDDYIVDLSGTSCSERVLQRRYNAIIRIIGGRDISIVGEPGSEIYGRNCYDAAGEEGYRGPHAITAFAATNLVLRGCTVRAAGNYSFYARDCSNVTVVDMAVHGGFLLLPECPGREEPFVLGRRLRGRIRERRTCRAGLRGQHVMQPFPCWRNRCARRELPWLGTRGQSASLVADARGEKTRDYPCGCRAAQHAFRLHALFEQERQRSVVKRCVSQLPVLRG